MKKIVLGLIAGVSLASSANATSYAEYDITFTGSGIYAITSTFPGIYQNVTFIETLQVIVKASESMGKIWSDCSLPMSSSLCTINGSSITGRLGSNVQTLAHFSLNGSGGLAAYNGLPYLDQVDSFSFDYMGGGHYNSYRLKADAASITTRFFDAPGNILYGIVGATLVTAGVPEPSSWLMMISGFGMVGGMIRRKRRSVLRFV